MPRVEVFTSIKMLAPVITASGFLLIANSGKFYILKAGCRKLKAAIAG
jgi:hypothetical protein